MLKEKKKKHLCASIDALNETHHVSVEKKIQFYFSVSDMYF